jgi:hypothetical protein
MIPVVVKRTIAISAFFQQNGSFYEKNDPFTLDRMFGNIGRQ